MKLAIAKEVEAEERRVALVPDVVARLVKQGVEVWVEAGAGAKSFFSDLAYEQAGARVVADTATLWGEADVVVKIGEFKESEVHQLREGGVCIGFLNPLGNPALVQRLADRKVTAFSMEMIPRTSRAQSMDALSSQANIAGYKAVLIAACALPKYFPMLTTAAGTIRPAKILVMGVGVAGLQAIATARRLGAVVEAFDIRPETKEQVQSLGAKFVDVELKEETVATGGYAKELSEAAKEYTRQVLTQHVSASDAVITTAQVPGRKAPILVTREMVSQMKPGSVIVDLAAEQGGNCECSEAGKDVEWNGVNVIGPINVPSSMPVHASETYSKNISALLQLMVKDKELNLNFEDDIIAGSCVAHNGEISNQRVRDALAAQASVVS
ncbi:Re/Si-specific NAD(P)(+) transhydrogenase subunit alpha [Microcoleus sp. bin38.metabat.b11b12b14.051]|uniref:Re/Si-specific NAD(P)(+) transhydrogenase subunit alpha n=1 Tax=Microcoleus sp. bin38.metabat.b11b12b14.051 TaxID=2742709 RepID=UPI0025E059ED|nr:Re/Si-specific NAD(P)(+) transhydrogenase subunit alpha [Microcoleus sp. bin38.metabat.b11b12b14.051]